MISTVPSVEPPSIMKYSRLGYPWSTTLLIVASMYRPWLNEGVTTDIFGQSPLSPFILRPSSHLRSHSTPEHLGRSGPVACRRNFRRSHPSIPVMDICADHEQQPGLQQPVPDPVDSNPVNHSEPRNARLT